jgi:hypothetical protein
MLHNVAEFKAVKCKKLSNRGVINMERSVLKEKLGEILTVAAGHIVSDVVLPFLKEGIKEMEAYAVNVKRRENEVNGKLTLDGNDM